jgi:hypothetical protein
MGTKKSQTKNEGLFSKFKKGSHTDPNAISEM